MHNIIFPLKDTTIYSKYPEVNTGLDEILEISKEISSSNYIYRGIWSSGVYYRRYDYVSSSNGNGYYYTVAENVSQETSSAYWVSFDPTTSNENSRILIKFDTASFDSKAYQSASVVYLNLFTSIARKVPTEYTLEAYPISGSWEMGVGNFTDKSTTRGATWTRNTSETNWSASGGDSTGSMASQDFNFVPTDVRMDVTDIFLEWSSGSYPNQGFLIKRPTAQENDNISYGSLSFYSLDTHTVYVPTLEIAYDDHIYDTSEFLVWNLKIYSTTSSTWLSIDSASLRYATTSSTDLNILSASLTSSQQFLIGGGLDYTTGTNIFITASVSQSATMTGVVNSYDTASGAITASITTVTGTGSYDGYDGWYVNLPTGQTVGYRNQYFTIAPQLPYTTGQTFVMTASAGNYMNGTVVDYNLTSGLMTASITYATGSGSSSLWNVELAAGEIPGYSVTGSVSGSLLSSGSIAVTMKRFKPEYKYNTTVRFRINVKPSYVAKTFYEELRQGEVYYLPDSASYSIRDAYSNRIMIPFSDYTKISVDETGHYFDVSLSGFMPERFYKTLFKVVMDGETQYFDSDNQFKVVK